MAAPSDIGSRIRERRAAKGIRQADLARQIGISASYLNLIEHNRRRIAGKLLSQIAAALEVDYTELVEGADQVLMERLQAASAAFDMPDGSVVQADELIRRFPDWAGLIRDQASRIERLERTVDGLNDRLTHDPALSAAVHEVLSTVSAVRSTASILANTPEIDPNWLGRFHTNLDADSRRLAEAAEAMVTYFEAETEQAEGYASPIEALCAYMDAQNHILPVLESDPEADIDAPDTALVQSFAQAYARDAARLPLDGLDPLADPLDIAAQTALPLATVLRRLNVAARAAGRTDVGLVETDGAGAVTYRAPVEGFPINLVSPGCPLWPLFQAITRPHTPVEAWLETPDGTRLTSLAVAEPIHPRSPNVVRATMLVRLAGTDPIPTSPLPVGPACRVCARAECPARREPSLVTT